MANASDSGRVRYVRLGQVSAVILLRGNEPSLFGLSAAGGGVECELIGEVSIRSFQDVNLATNGPLIQAMCVRLSKGRARFQEMTEYAGHRR
jgi:hypothetical protein